MSFFFVFSFLRKDDVRRGAFSIKVLISTMITLEVWALFCEMISTTTFATFFVRAFGSFMSLDLTKVAKEIETFLSGVTEFGAVFTERCLTIIIKMTLVSTLLAFNKWTSLSLVTRLVAEITE